uniref:hypothetical protein n=1 Tax=Streptomyces asoensis TaxID=249586 RepID=UPI001C0F1FA2|nr:hypothetical protein [Streptomyces asoensis]
MANIVWHTKFQILLDLTMDDLDHPELPDLWETIYKTDRYYGQRGVPVHQRDLQCGGICREAGVEAWMHLRLRANGHREAVHERREDEARHTVPMSDEHKAYQERILRAAEEGGFHSDSEVRTRVGRSWIQTDTLVEGADGRRIGWEVQLSSVGSDGLRGVRARAAKAEKNGITPAWHTDRSGGHALDDLVLRYAAEVVDLERREQSEAEAVWDLLNVRLLLDQPAARGLRPPGKPAPRRAMRTS